MPTIRKDLSDTEFHSQYGITRTEALSVRDEVRQSDPYKTKRDQLQRERTAAYAKERATRQQRYKEQEKVLGEASHTPTTVTPQTSTNPKPTEAPSPSVDKAIPNLTTNDVEIRPANPSPTPSTELPSLEEEVQTVLQSDIESASPVVSEVLSENEELVTTGFEEWVYVPEKSLGEVAREVVARIRENRELSEEETEEAESLVVRAIRLKSQLELITREDVKGYVGSKAVSAGEGAREIAVEAGQAIDEFGRAAKDYVEDIPRRVVNEARRIGNQAKRAIKAISSAPGYTGLTDDVDLYGETGVALHEIPTAIREGIAHIERTDPQTAANLAEQYRRYTLTPEYREEQERLFIEELRHKAQQRRVQDEQDARIQRGAREAFLPPKQNNSPQAIRDRKAILDSRKQRAMELEAEQHREYEELIEMYQPDLNLPAVPAY